MNRHHFVRKEKIVLKWSMQYLFPLSGNDNSASRFEKWHEYTLGQTSGLFTQQLTSLYSLSNCSLHHLIRYWFFLSSMSNIHTIYFTVSLLLLLLWWWWWWLLVFYPWPVLPATMLAYIYKICKQAINLSRFSTFHLSWISFQLESIFFLSSWFVSMDVCIGSEIISMNAMYIICIFV